MRASTHFSARSRMNDGRKECQTLVRPDEAGNEVRAEDVGDEHRRVRLVPLRIRLRARGRLDDDGLLPRKQNLTVYLWADRAPLIEAGPHSRGGAACTSTPEDSTSSSRHPPRAVLPEAEVSLPARSAPDIAVRFAYSPVRLADQPEIATRELTRGGRCYFVSRMTGRPSFPAPTMMTFVFGDCASFSVASTPFHRSS